MTEAGIRLATAGPKRVSCFELSSYFEDLVLVSDFELRYSDFTANNADASIFKLELTMPSFDIVSEVDMQEIDNAVNQARKELATRFDFKGSVAEITVEKEKITLTAEDASRLKGLREILLPKFGKRGVDLRNIEQVDPAISPLGHARQELKIQQGLEGDKAKEIIQAIKSQNFKVQCQLQDRQIRVTGKKRDDLQAVIAFIRGRDFEVSTVFKNFRD